MENKLEKAFKNIGESTTLAVLPARILGRIDFARQKQAKRQMVISRVVGAVSLVAFFPLLVSAINQLQVSGFWNYFSLIFTDTSAMAANWRDFLLSLTDTLPIFQLSLTLFLLFTFFISLRFINLPAQPGINSKKYEFKF